MNLESLISELLLRHNCVIIPSFGGFVAGQVPAHFDTDKGVILPPRKSLLFNKQLISNDGLLIATYAKYNHLNYDVAEFFIRDTVKKWHDKLAKGERVSIENVGFLYLDAEKNIGFEQDRYNNLLLASYGLGNVHFIPETEIQFVVNEKTGRVSIDEPIEVEPKTPSQPLEPIEEPVIEATPIEEEEEKELAPIIDLHPKKKAWKYIAAAVLLPIAFYSYWIPAKSDVLQSGLISFRDFNPASPQQKGNYNSKTIDFSIPKIEERESIEKMSNNLPQDVDVFAFYYQNDIIIPVRIHEEVKYEETNNLPIPVTIPKKEALKQSVLVPKTEINSAANKHIIVGCFSTVNNANKLVSKLKAKGFDAYIVDAVNGLHRVSALNSSNDSAILSTTKRLNALQISTWILKK